MKAVESDCFWIVGGGMGKYLLCMLYSTCFPVFPNRVIIGISGGNASFCGVYLCIIGHLAHLITGYLVQIPPPVHCEKSKYTYIFSKALWREMALLAAKSYCYIPLKK